jgi:transposase
LDFKKALLESNERIAHIETLMKTMSKDDPIMDILQTIPGIGPITAFALRHKIDTIDRFRDASHLSSYFGFGVRERQSGETTVKGKIAKTGDPLLRKLLIQGAQIIRSCRPDLVALYFPMLGQAERMKNRKHANKVVTAMARKNLTLVYHLWKRQMPFDLEIYKARRQEALTASATIPATSVCRSLSAAELDLTLVR